jgi:hypothetical protein
MWGEMAELTKVEQAIFEEVLRTGDVDLFTEHFFQLAKSGTWYCRDHNEEQYHLLYATWFKAGKPGKEFSVVLQDSKGNDIEVELDVEWDYAFYGDDPMFLLRHGFRTLPWLKMFLNPEIPLGIAITGTGTGKTCGVAIWALTMCALFPGFRFLNVAPSRTQAELMLNEVEKWCSNTKFRKFIKESPRGAHPLWVSRPHATMKIEVNEGYASTFVCQTVNRDASAILGQEQDFINCDEAQLLENIDESLPILATRMRGTRITGAPRWGMLRWISNPGKNPELMALMDHYREIEEDSEQAIVLEGIHSSVNIYITKRQLEKQELSLISQRSKDRWHGGESSAVYQDQEISEDHLELCKDEEMDALVQEIGRFDDLLGLRHYDLKYKPGHSYVVCGDVGKSTAATLSSMNLPCVLVFDVTNFLKRPIEMVAFHWFDGGGSYDPFIDTMQAMMLRYNASAYYDATNVQTAFEDVRDAAFDGWPTTPVFFSGSVIPKRWSLTIVNRLMGDGMFQWPYIKGLWHQARLFDPTSRRIPDDIIAALMVFGLALRTEDTLWTLLEDKYKWKLNLEEEKDDPTVDFKVYVEERPVDADRYAATTYIDRY